MIKRPAIYNQCIKYITLQEQYGNTFIIAPPQSLKIGKIEHNPENIKRTYEIGRKTALDNLDRVKAFLEAGDDES